MERLACVRLSRLRFLPMHCLDLLKLAPTCPEACGMHSMQAPLLATLRPGQWSQSCGWCKTNWHRERWMCRKVGGGSSLDPGEIIDALVKCEDIKEQATHHSHDALRSANFSVHKKTATSIVIFFFTTHKQWLDVIEIELAMGSAMGETLEFSAYSFSAAVVPASSPLALLSSIFLAFIPFSDFGQNELHCRTLRQLLKDQGLEVVHG